MSTKGSATQNHSSAKAKKAIIMAKETKKISQSVLVDLFVVSICSILLLRKFKSFCLNLNDKSVKKNDFDLKKGLSRSKLI